MDEMFNFSTANKVNNSTIINKFQFNNSKLVLCYWQTNEFVTWRVDNNGICFWGRYFNNLVDAKNSFIKQCKTIIHEQQNAELRQ